MSAGSQNSLKNAEGSHARLCSCATACSAQGRDTKYMSHHPHGMCTCTRPSHAPSPAQLCAGHAFNTSLSPTHDTNPTACKQPSAYANSTTKNTNTSLADRPCIEVCCIEQQPHQHEPYRKTRTAGKHTTLDLQGLLTNGESTGPPSKARPQPSTGMLPKSTRRNRNHHHPHNEAMHPRTTCTLQLPASRSRLTAAFCCL